MRFKVGDILIYKPKVNNNSAQSGAKVIFQGYDEPYIRIKWIDLLSRGQCDGSYFADDFIFDGLKEIRVYEIAKWCKVNYK